MKSVVFFGDSITQLAVQKNGYINRLHSLLEHNSLKKDFRMIGSGIGGNRITDLIHRYKRDVISHHPDLIFIYIGINDVWHFAPIKDKEREEQFKSNYQLLLSSIRNDTNARLILCTPSVIGERISGNSYDHNLDTYSSIIKSIALEYQLRVCDLRTLFLSYLKEWNTDDKSSDILTTDGVHLNSLGNKLVADAFYPFLISE